MGGHKGVAAGVKSDAEENQRVHCIAEAGGSGGRHPPGFEPAQFVEHENIQQLRHGIGGEARQRDPADEGVEAGDGRPAGPTALAEPHRHGIRERERRQHHPKNNAPRQLAAENAHGQIGGEKDKGKGKRAPSGVKAE